ncbi:ExbD/TolR family protein [Pseudofulvibacter geojedonensis]|uniref:ExbD/TolR family protein n=1 Tax=Pseudofulvibacter geojedonensis TaxID=1123758 RepID=A0ABW3I4B1_9FLAO
MNIRGRNKVTPEFNMSSMTDIVFLLLIFFMIASTLVSTNAIDLLLPKSGGKTTQSKSLSVSITKDLTYYVDNQKVEKERLEAYILDKINTLEKPSIVLRAEETVELKDFVYVMDIANRNKIKSTLAVRPQ